jgi:hypothetical protein
MNNFIDRFSGLFKDVLTGFDRIVSKGFILPLIPAFEVIHFCRIGNILDKYYKDWMLAHARKIIVSAEQYAKDNCSQSVTYIPTWRIRNNVFPCERE